MRVLGYLRKVEQGLSLQEQQKALERFCQAGSHRLATVYVDEAAQPSDWRQLQALLDQLHSSGRRFLVAFPGAFYLGASLSEGLARLFALESAGATVACTDPQNADPLRSALTHWSQGEASFARGARIREAMRARAIRGQGLGKPPYGYRIVKGGRLAEQAEEAEVVRRIFHLYTQQRLGVRQVARVLNEDAQSTRRQQPWSMVTIRDILRNRVYLGTYSRFGMVVPASHPALITREEHRQAQEQMERRRPHRRQAQKEPFLLSGLVRCEHCGNRMIGITRRQSWRRKDGSQVERVYRYYQCQSRTNRSLCQYRTWRAIALEAAVKQRLLDRLASSPAVLLSPSDAGSELIPASNEAEIRLLRRLRRVVEGRAPRASLQKAVAGLVPEGGGLPAPGDASLAGHEPFTATALEAAWTSASVEGLRGLLGHLIQGATVRDQAVQVMFR